MEQQEADNYMRAAANVLRHYDIRTTQKALDWGAFIMATGQVYGTRLVAIQLRKKLEKAAAAPEPAPPGMPAMMPLDPVFGRPPIN